MRNDWRTWEKKQIGYGQIMKKKYEIGMKFQETGHKLVKTTG